MTLCDIFEPRSIVNLEGATKDAVFEELIWAIRDVHPDFDHDEMLAAIQERENSMSTGVGSGIAIPHGYCRSLATVSGALGVSRTGIAYNALDKQPVHVVFMLLMGEAAHENHLRVLNQIFMLARSEALAMIKSAKNAREIHDILSRVP